MGHTVYDMLPTEVDGSKNIMAASVGLGEGQQT